jgi:hypothetical protein
MMMMMMMLEHMEKQKGAKLYEYEKRVSGEKIFVIFCSNQRIRLLQTRIYIFLNIRLLPEFFFYFK